MAVSAAPPTGRSTTAPPPLAPDGSPAPAIPGAATPPSTGANESVRYRIAHWMENHFGRAYVPIAMAAGGLAGGTIGALTLGPIGAIAGAAGGALLGGVLVFTD